MKHDGLLDALDEATAPSRELDARIMIALDPDGLRLPSGDLDSHFPQSFAPGAYWCGEGHGQFLRHANELTASLEAAFVLAEKFAPHGRIMVERDHAGDGWAMMQLSVNSTRSMAFGKTPAMALCSALLDALQTASEPKKAKSSQGDASSQAPAALGSKD